MSTRSLRPLLVAVVAALSLSACTAEQFARSFQGWCKNAPNCDDHSRREL